MEPTRDFDEHHHQTRLGRDTVSLVISDRDPRIRGGQPADFVKPFAREDVAHSERGAGLGLSIADRVVRLHGGDFRVENAVDGGWIAIVELPIASAVVPN